MVDESEHTRSTPNSTPKSYVSARSQQTELRGAFVLRWKAPSTGCVESPFAWRASTRHQSLSLYGGVPWSMRCEREMRVHQHAKISGRNSKKRSSRS